MKRTLAATLVVVVLLITVFVVGDAPGRRYADDECQYQLIFQGRGEMGLLTVGGSRVRVSTRADHFDEILKKLKVEALPIHNLGHATFSLEKEYVLLDDLFRRRSPKAVLVMIEPRRNDRGVAHRDFIDIASFRHIPLAIWAVWPESPVNALKAASDIIRAHMHLDKRVDSRKPKKNQRNCGIADHRLDIGSLLRADDRHAQAARSTLDWDINSSDEEGFRRWIEAYVRLAKKHDVELMFIHLASTAESLPSADFEGQFEAATGAKLITFDRDIHVALAANGKRDAIHINDKGRPIFLPWLVDQIKQKCTRPDGCL